MCLETITHGPNLEEEGEGYKVFEIHAGELLAPLKNFTFVKNEWLSDSEDFDIDEGEGFYRTGFHIFSNREDAEAYYNSLTGCTGRRDFVIEKVKYRNVCAKGLHLRDIFGNDPRLAQCVVAREIFIPDKED